MFRYSSLAALVAAAGFVQALVHAPEVAAGGVLVESMVWIDQLDLSVSFVMDPLGLLLALVVTGVGALVLLYCARYFRGDDARIGVFAGTFMAFAGAMYGLVLADDDLAALCLVPGVGKKTAARLLVELKNSLDLPIDGVPASDDDPRAGRSAVSEVQEALGGLGYTSDEVRGVLVDLGGDDPAVLLREALQRLARA